MEDPRISVVDGSAKVSFGRASVTLTIGDLAACVAEMSSTEQAEFIAELARRFAGFDGSLGPSWQMYKVGEDLGKTPGGSEGADMLRSILESAEESLVRHVMES